MLYYTVGSSKTRKHVSFGVECKLFYFKAWRGEKNVNQIIMRHTRFSIAGKKTRGHKWLLTVMVISGASNQSPVQEGTLPNDNYPVVFESKNKMLWVSLKHQNNEIFLCHSK